MLELCFTFSFYILGEAVTEETPPKQLDTYIFFYFDMLYSWK